MGPIINIKKTYLREWVLYHKHKLISSTSATSQCFNHLTGEVANFAALCNLHDVLHTHTHTHTHIYIYIYIYIYIGTRFGERFGLY